MMRLHSFSAPLLLIWLGAGSPFTDCDKIGCWRCPNGTCTQCWQAWGAAATGECQSCGVKGVCQDGSCASGFITQGGGCAPCADNCAGCGKVGPGKCDRDMCRPRFTLSPAGFCAQCPKHCHACSTEGSCETCESGYTVTADKATCVACGSFCSFCSEAGRCDKGRCFAGFSLAADGTCKPCDKPKIRGSPFTQCAACENLGPGTCDDAELCAGGREKWSGSDVWTLDSTGKCRRCAKGCTGCEFLGAGKCDPGNCIGTRRQPMGSDGHGHCAPCPRDCLECANASRCDRCAAKRAPLIQLTVQGECISCALYCGSCQRAGAGRCDPHNCHLGFGPAADGTCSRCPKGCLDCASGPVGTCQRCRLGLGLLRNGTCGPCPQHCEACVRADSCDAGRCFPNFELYNGRCRALTGRLAAPSRSVRAPASDGVLVIPITAPTYDGVHCLRLLDLETGKLLDELGEFCMAWTNTVGLHCSLDAHRGVFYFLEDNFLRRIDMDTWKQLAHHELASRLDVMTVDTVLNEVIGVLHVFDAQESYTVSVSSEGMLRFWASQWKLSGTWGHNTIAAWSGAAVVPTFKFPLFSLVRDQAPVAVSSHVRSWAAIRFDEASGKLYGIGRNSTMQHAKNADELRLYELALQVQVHNGIRNNIVHKAVPRCLLSGLYNVFEGDTGSYSFFARGRLHVVGAQSPNHVRDRIYFVDVDTCETGWLNWSLRKAMGSFDWTCIADRTALLAGNSLYPMHQLPKAPRVAAIPAAVPHGFGCFEDSRMPQLMLLEHFFLMKNAGCLNKSDPPGAKDQHVRSQKRCDAGDAELRQNCSRLGGQLCTARVRSGPQRDWVRESPVCLPASCLQHQLARLAVRDDTIYRWCPTLPFTANQFLYNCDVKFHSCHLPSSPGTVSITSSQPVLHESAIPLDMNPVGNSARSGVHDVVPRADSSGPGLGGTLRGMLIGSVVGASVGVGALLVWRCSRERFDAFQQIPERHESEIVGAVVLGEDTREV